MDHWHLFNFMKILEMTTKAAWHIEPGLDTFYDIWPGNGLGLVFQPWSPHGGPGPGACMKQ